jgi:hypothetical protein
MTKATITALPDPSGIVADPLIEVLRAGATCDRLGDRSGTGDASAFGAAPNTRRALKKLIAPLLDLVRMTIKVLRQFDQGLLALSAATATFALNAELWRLAWASCHGPLFACSIMPLVRRKST